MRRGTKLFLLAGCAFVVVLEAPATYVVLAAGWRGPYALPDVRSADAGPPGALTLAAAGPAWLDLARR